MIIQSLIITALLAGGPYVSVKGGVSHLENHELHFQEFTYDNGWAVSSSAGYDFGYIRLEGEYLRTSNDIDKIWSLDRSSHVNSFARITKDFYFINGLLDVPIYKRFEGYIGAGYGFPRWQLMGGLKYGLTKHWGIDLGYRFVHEPYEARAYKTHPVLGDICGEFKNGICSGPEPVYENHIITIGITYNFGD